MDELIKQRIVELEDENAGLRREAEEREGRMRTLVEQHNSAMSSILTRKVQVEGAIAELTKLLKGDEDEGE